MHKNMKKNIILFVNAMRPATFDALKAYEEKTGRTFTPLVLVDRKIQTSISERNGQNLHHKNLLVVNADFDSPMSIRKALRLYEDRIFAVTCQYENSMLELKKLIGYFPYLQMPTQSSIEWSTEKKLMRELLESYDVSLVPEYMEISDYSESSIKSIEAHLDYPVIVKPSGLEGSLLVTMANNRLELNITLERTFRDIQGAYVKWIKRQTPRLLVEEFMDGDMYSVDTYVDSQGVCYSNPVVKVITGRKVGFEDFFGYMQGVPSNLNEQEATNAQKTAEKASHALGLRSVTAHVELMKLHQGGWKVIELAPRIGGYRHEIYSLGYGINHIMNDTLNRAGETPQISHKLVAHTALFHIYANDEGTIRAIKGIEEIKQLKSFFSLKQNSFLGDTARFAKNNGDPILSVVLTNSKKSMFESDVESMQTLVAIEVDKIPQPLKAKYFVSS
jgi:biotin carboxylase